MNRRTFFLFNIIAISITNLLLFSCSKESTLIILTDTTIFAKIIQPASYEGKDAIIESISPSQNYGTTEYFTVFSWTNAGLLNKARALIKFDLSSIPPQTKITAAELSFFWNSYENLKAHTGENAFSIYRILENWDEDTVNWENQPSVSNSNAITINKSIYSNQSYTHIDVTAQIQSMIDNPSENHGFMLKLDEESPYKLVILASSECTESEKRPKLVIFY